MQTLLIATHNAHKVGEIRAILGNEFQLLTLNDFPGAPAVVEDAETFAGNAQKKATELASWLAANNSKLKIKNSKPDFVLADDSGLEVDVLGGQPGVHSARFAAADSASSGNTPDADNNAKLLRLLQNFPAEKRTARFRCVIAIAPVLQEKSEVASPVCYAREPEFPTFDGTCEGKLTSAPAGQNGFGYDPLFVPDGFTQTFAELGEPVKNKLSHRAKALEKLKKFFNHQATKAQN